MWSMLFGLLMWDCLFADVADTLRTQFQLAPLDLSTSHFYEALPHFTPHHFADWQSLHPPCLELLSRSPDAGSVRAAPCV